MWPLLIIAAERSDYFGQIAKSQDSSMISLINKQLPLLTCYFEFVNACACRGNNPNYEVLSDRRLVYELLGFQAQISTSVAVFCNLTNTT